MVNDVTLHSRRNYTLTGFSRPRRGIYSTWQNMKQRCLNPNHPTFSCYGGRGIKICDEWLDIVGFVAWARSSGYEDGLTIDRIDNDADYEPSNCRWVTKSDNSRRKRTTKLSPEQAAQIRQRLAQGANGYALADEYGVVYGTIWHIRHGHTHTEPGKCRTGKRRVRAEAVV